jgi:APA family basic amino acid/polyamine antiporter
MYFFESKNFSPFFIKDKGFEGVIESATILFFGYLGFDFMTTVTEEAINPIRDVPKAILISVVLSMLIYVVVTVSVSGVGNISAGVGDGETVLAEIF